VQEPENVSAALSNEPAIQSQPLVFDGNEVEYLASEPGMKQKVIFDLFSEEEQSSLIKKLFKNDEGAFRGAVIELSFLHAWDEVAQYLDKLFVANEADPFSADAVLFTDKLFMHFHSPDDEI
jgi:hypothetical protein